jgi:hypothetical protein
MKKWILTEMAVVVLLFSTSCKETKKEQAPVENATTYTLVEDSTQINFTAYKTSEKLPVGGTFTEYEIEYEKGSSVVETLDGLSFSIPVSSLFTNDATNTRDAKILEFFFNKMAETQQLTGTFSVAEDQTCVAKLNMNGITADFPMTYEITEDGHVNFNGTMDLTQWNALEALASLNEACKELHTGADGVSKTWSEVGLSATVYLTEE